MRVALITRAMFLAGSKYRERKNSKGSPKEHSCEIISKSDQRFQRRSKFRKKVLKNLIQGTFL